MKRESDEESEESEIILASEISPVSPFFGQFLEINQHQDNDKKVQVGSITSILSSLPTDIRIPKRNERELDIIIHHDPKDRDAPYEKLKDNNLKESSPIPQVEGTCKVLMRTGPMYSWCSGTLLSPEWVVTVGSRYKSDQLEGNGDIFYTDLNNNTYYSSIDKFVCLDKELLEIHTLPKELLKNSFVNFRIIFAHLSNPIPVNLPKIDRSSTTDLIGKRATVVGYDWPDVTTRVSLSEESRTLVCKVPPGLNHVDPFLELTEAPKKGISFSIYPTKDHVTLCDLVFEIDDYVRLSIEANYRVCNKSELEFYLPFPRNLPIEKDRLASISRQITRGVENPSTPQYQDGVRLGSFISGIVGTPALSKQLVFKFKYPSKKGSSGKQNSLSFPEIQAEDGMTNTKDVGSGIYILSAHDEPCLAGILLNGVQKPLKATTINGKKVLEAFVIMPMSFLCPFFEEICLGKNSLVKPFSEQELRVKKKKKSRSKAKPSPAQGPPKPQSNLSNSASSSEEGIPLPHVQKVPIAERLKDTYWAAIITKEVPGRTPYKEVYYFKFAADGGCRQNVGVLKHGFILGDHASVGTWNIDDDNPYRLNVNLTIRSPRPNLLTFAFNITENGDTLTLTEARNRRKKQEEYDATGKERSNMVLKQFSNNSKNPLSIFSEEERYQGILSVFGSTLTSSTNKMEMYQTSHSFRDKDRLLDKLCGCWKDENQESLIIQKGTSDQYGKTSYHATNGDVNYQVEIKERYNIKDFKLNRPAYVLRLIPLDSDERAIDLGIYFSSQHEPKVLSTPEAFAYDRTKKQYKCICSCKFYTKT